MGNDEDPDISVLQSEVMYHKLDKGSDGYITDNGAFWEGVIKTNVLKTLPIFPTLAKAFYYVCTMKSNEGKLYDERWNYLYFWTRLKVLENSSFSDIMDLLKIVKSVNDSSKPYDKDMFDINTQEFMDLKKIYDYLQNYHTIYLKVGSSDNAPCTAEYKKYITTSYDLYIKEKVKCEYNDKDSYCKVVNRFVREYGKKDIIKLSCNGTKDPKEPQIEEEEEEDFGEIESADPARRDTPHASHLSRGQIDTDDTEIPDGYVSHYSGSTNAISTVFPLLGTASLAFFFLKFTPLGSRLYNSILRKQIIGTNEEEAQEILENSYEFSNSNFEENSHHIAYHNM
ncbi:PIR Superfamily Protein [Plasmodium ovale wallikeri]|uniref:PIR Superfamily Protein n=1 Tax=Plasmodium ovale wallikeri TaxID=864142 RepID=A0A1A9AIF4_PLAOA|nr:PIR Superfamily Protein [Plasmodium ovale wallikeri]